jgi:carboxypeptidase C (cathepsin A)
MAKPSFVIVGGTPESLSLSDSASAALGAAIGAAKPAPAETPRPAPVMTEHEGSIGGKAVRYRATAGFLPVRDGGEGKTKAEMFFVAYELIGVDQAERRPVSFVFNGGPGSSSVWLHMGALGPKRVQLDPEGRPLPGPGKAIDNDQSWLDLTDLVFIDPVSTGLSRAATGEDAKQFHTLEDDVKSFGEFIRLYLTRQQRWMSPKFLVGESYGATRAAALAKHLQSDLGIFVAGITLVSPALDFQLLSFDHGNDIAHVLFLPTYAATALYHGLVKPAAGSSAADLIKVVEKFAIERYLPALAMGASLPVKDAESICGVLASFTGIDAAVWRRKHLRIRDDEFFRELLRDRATVVGRLDTRFTCSEITRPPTDINADPSYAAVVGAFSTALHSHLLGTLKYVVDTKYEILFVNTEHWNFNAPNRYVSTSPHLLCALIDNPQLRVHVCAGWYDAATPHFAADFSVSHLAMQPGLKERITTTYYEAGHMVYTRAAELVNFKKNAAVFYASAAPETP